MTQTRNTWYERPPVVVVCPDCNSGIYQHRDNKPIDCNDCTHYNAKPNINEYEIVRFDCPDCGGNIENYSTRNLTGIEDEPDTIIAVRCGECDMWWEAPHE